MFDKFKRIFKDINQRTFKLIFAMDINESGDHVVEIQKMNHSGQWEKVDLNKLIVYGYQEEVIDDNQTFIYTVSDNDRQTLLSLKSLNPTILSNGLLVFEIEPPILQYLRKKQIPETNAAQTVKISDDPIRPSATVSFDPKEGIKVEAGYKIKDQDPIVSAKNIKKTNDGKYTRIGNIFVPIVEATEKARKYLDAEVTKFALHDIPEFFQRDLVLIKKEFNAVLTDMASQIRVINEPMEPKVSVKKNALGWLDFNIVYNAKGFVLPQNVLRKLQNTGSEYISPDPYTWIKMDVDQIKETQKKLDAMNAEVTPEGYRIPASEFASLQEFIEEIGGIAEVDQAYKQFINQLTGFQPNHNFPLPSSLEAQLSRNNINIRAYQRGGVHWLDWLRRNHLHGILADDMGLGKTLQSLINLFLAYEETKTSQHSLIVAPKSVLLHWQREIQRVFYFMRVYIYHGSYRRKDLFQSGLPYIFITTYDMIVKDTEILARIPFYYLIIDEATRIKNPDASRSKAIKSLNAVHRLALSGTPVENRPSELWSLYDFLMRGHLGKHGTFVREFEEAIMAGNVSASQRLGRRIKPFILRRKKEEVAQDLPEKIVMTEFVSLTTEQRNLYGGLLDEMKRIRKALQNGERVDYTASILPVLTKLKQICDHPALFTREFTPIQGRSEKFDWIMEKVQEIVGVKEKVIIFSHFLDMLSLFEKSTQLLNIPYIRIDGGTNNRQALIDQFNLGDAQVALLSIMAAGYGINMTSANHVIHADRWWNPATEDQATDRVHRIGQTKTVYVYQILTEGTLEEKIDALLNKKRGMADQIMAAAVQGAGHWSREELLELLKPLD